MRLKKLGCKYFMHYGPWSEMHFSEDQTIVSIIGQWADDPKRSNRSGKSTLVEAILYGLYGKSRSKKEIDLINKNYPEENMLVELTFDNDIIISRGRTNSNQIILELTGFEGADKKVVQDEIDRLVGLSYDDFIMTSFFMQGDIHTFMEAGATGQKQMIAKWLEKDYWKDYEKKAKEKVQELSRIYDKLEIATENKPDPLEDQQITNNINLLDVQKKSIETQIETLENQLELTNDQINNLASKTEIELRIDECRRTIHKMNIQISSYEESIKGHYQMLPEAFKREKQLQQLPELLDKLNLIKTVMETTKSEYDTVYMAYAGAKAKVNELRSQYNEIKNFNNICPVMQKECLALDAVYNTKDELVKKGQNAKKYADELLGKAGLLESKYKKMVESYEVKMEIAREIKTYKKFASPDEIQTVINEAEIFLGELQEELRITSDNLIAYEEQLRKLPSIDIKLLKSQKISINDEIIVKKKELSDIIINIAGLQAKLEQNEELRRKALEASKELKKVLKSLNLYKYVSYMFSKNGIPSNQVEVAFNEIEDETNIILEKINSDISIEFSAEKEMNSWEENCLVCGFLFPKGFRKPECPECNNSRQKKKKDELSIKIITKGKEIDFNLESGGGKVLISLAIRLAFVRMLQRRLGVNLKMIIFDEIFGMLDGLNRGLVLRLLTTTLIEDFGFSQIFVISHESEIRDVIPHVIKVIKYDQHSEVDWG